MDTEREEIHALSTETHTQNMGQDNNSPAENVHNTVSGILRQWIERKRRNTCTFNRNTHSKYGTTQQLTS